MSEEVVQVVYEDDEVKLLYKGGQGDFLLITFSDLVTRADSDRFFADVPAAKLSLPCLAFVATRGNWFPSANVHAAIRAADTILNGFQNRVVYGGSMGGYGAIKYSPALGATEVLALCPQWSLDREECDGVDPGWQNHFEPQMAGMGIRREDTAGRTFVFADILDEVDAFHISKIMPTLAEGHLIKVPFVGHNLTPVFAGTNNLAALIEAARNVDLDTMRRLARRVRKDNYHRISRLLRAGLAKRPDLTLGLLAAAAISGSAYEARYAEHGTAVIRWLVARGKSHLVPAVMDVYGKHAADIGAYFRQFMVTAHLLGQDLSLLDYRGREVLFDLHHGGLHGHGGSTDPVRVPPALSLLGRDLTMEIQVSTLKATIGPNEHGIFRYLYLAKNYVARAKFSEGVLSLRYETGYLSSQPDGTVVANGEVLSEQEGFRLALKARPAGR